MRAGGLKAHSESRWSKTRLGFRGANVGRSRATRSIDESLRSAILLRIYPTDVPPVGRPPGVSVETSFRKPVEAFYRDCVRVDGP